jgi:two-component system sensor histidine kinase KdpD
MPAKYKRSDKVNFLTNVKNNLVFQYFTGLGLISLIAIVAHFSVDLTGYKVVALLLLLAVSILAMVFDIWPVLLAAIYSALLWNFFFIPPLLKFTIDTPEDALLFLMYFVIALLNAVLTAKIRKAERRAREKEERENTIKLYNTVFSSLSHELKTPISTIIGAVDTLKESANNLSAQHQRELLTEIDIAGIRLHRQVENLLSMSRLESGFIQPQRDWCDLSELIFRVIRMLPDDTEEKQIEFDPPEQLPLFKLDRGLMEQILFNIIHNAMQYTPAQTRIEIGVAHVNDGCRITISDNGPGIPKEALTAIFKKFYRLPNTAAGGTGLGLSIVKGFVEAQDGEVHLSSRPGGGARFEINIPAETSQINAWQNE